MSSAPKTCADCGVPLDPRNRLGYCRRHTGPRLMQDPQTRSKMARSRRLMFQHNPEKRAAQAERMLVARATPEARAARSAQMRGNKLWIAGNAAMPKGSEPRMRAGANTRATRADRAGIPPDMRERYYFLTRVKRLKQAEAKALVLEEHAVELRRFRRSLGIVEERPSAPNDVPVRAALRIPGRLVPATIDDAAAARIIAVIADAFGVASDEITGPRRLGRIIPARRTCAYVLQRLGNTYTTVGGWLGGRDHTTVGASVRQFEALATPEMRELAARIVGEPSC